VYLFNGTSVLLLALKALDIGVGDEVKPKPKRWMDKLFS
jgi:hypothetical protein